jgi:hypothetical protein
MVSTLAVLQMQLWLSASHPVLVISLLTQSACTRSSAGFRDRQVHRGNYP